MTTSAFQMQKALTRAWDWLKKQREHYRSTDSIWSLRLNWTADSQIVLHALNTGEYAFAPATMMTTKAGTRVTRVPMRPESWFV